MAKDKGTKSLAQVANALTKKADAKEAKLPKDVANKYKLVGIQAGPAILPTEFGGHRVDFRTISVEDAADLVKRKYPHLVAK